MLAVRASCAQNEHMISSEEPTSTGAPDDDNVYSVVDRIMISFGHSLEELDGFTGVGTELSTLFRREKTPSEAEVRAILEGSDK